MNIELFDTTGTAPGLFVTVDGPNGSGKTSLIEAIVVHLERTHRLHSTRQPSPTPLGELIRGSERSYTGRALACLIAGDRHHQIATEILPHLQTGEIVLCDRYVESSLVLQRLDGVDVEEIIGFNRGILRPDVRIRLLAEASVLHARLAARTTDTSRRFERDPHGPERELAYYADADQFLTHEHGLPATLYDTSYTQATELGVEVAGLVTKMFADLR